MLAMEKDIWCIAGLHELHGKPLKTRKDQCIRNSQSYGKEAVSPILFKLTQDISDIAFIDQGIGVCNICDGTVQTRSDNDSLLVSKRDLGVRNEAGKKNGMGLSAFPASDPLDAEGDQFTAGFHFPVIKTIENKSSDLPAGTFHFEKWKGENDFVIEAL